MDKLDPRPTDQEPNNVKPVTLPNDFGADISFLGQFLTDNSEYDEETGELTKQTLYRTDDGWLAYSVVTATEKGKERRAYLIEEQDDERCFISNGDLTLEARVDDLVELLVESWLEDAAKKKDQADKSDLGAINE